VKLRCVRCGGEIAVPPEAVTSPGGAVVCPSCGARYKRNPTRTSATLGDLRATVVDGRSPAARVAPPRSTDGPGTPTGAAPPPAAAEPPIFAPDTVLAGRYRVQRFIAQGGMGEVYEAEDLELRVSVALKTVSPRVAEDELAAERFRREIQLARRVTHPNVCRIFDVGYHELGTASRTRRVAFLTMELLRGETLGERIRRQGRLAPEVALPLLRQAAAGLQAAHRAGVVHRDFKSENVFLVEDREEPGGVRAVVTDFGIARAADQGTARLTSTGVVGTPAYMAPEQVQGGEVTAAVDVYAFGLVAYETVTGRLPFEAETALATAVKRLTEMPLSPRVHVPDLDRRWEAVILRCLEREPAERYLGPLEAIEALAAGAPTTARAPVPPAARPASAPVAPPRPAARPDRRRILATVLLGLLAVAAASAWLRIRARRSDGLAAVTAPRRSVAVLGFRNLSGRADAAWLSTALAEMLNTELGAAGGLRVVSGDLVEQAKLDVRVAENEPLPAPARARLRALLGADYLVLGSYAVLGEEGGGTLRIDARLEDALVGEPLGAVAEDGAQVELFELVRRVGAALRRRLDPGATGGGERRSAASRFSAEGARLYAEGIGRLRRFEPLPARELLERAVAVDPDNALGRSALAAAWSALGYDERARAEAKRAFDLAAELPAEERLAVEGRYWEAVRDWGKAIEVYRTLWARYPDNLENALRLAAAQTAAGRAREGLVTVAAGRALPPPARDDPRLDLAEAQAAAALSDFPLQRQAAARAVAASERLGASLLAAQARIAECWALRNLGEPQAALGACGEGERRYTAVGDRSGLAFALSTRAGVLYDQGDLAGARRVYEEALATYRSTGDQNGVARALNNIAVVARNQGRGEEARRLYGEVLALCKSIGDRYGAAQALNNIAVALSHEGDLGGARRMLEEALVVRRELGDRAGEAYALANLGTVRRQLGELEGAREALEQSLAIRRDTGQRVAEVSSLVAIGRLLLERGDLEGARERFTAALAACRDTGNKSCAALALSGLGELDATAGDLAAARGRHDEALALRAETGERAAAAESRLALAQLALEGGDAAAAASALVDVLAELEATGERDDQALAHAALVRCHLASGDRAAAQREAAAAQTLAAASQNLPVSLAVAVAAARAQAAAGAPPPALAALAQVADEARRLGFVGLAFEARLAAAEIAAAGGAPEARQTLSALAREAASVGFSGIAARATRAAAGAGA
jgi:tetratricopeptide (TPR) repeat protein